MEYAGNQELRRIRNGSLLFLALCSCSGVLLVWLERKRCLAQTGAALYDLYGEQSRTILLSMMAESSQTVLIGAVVWFVLLSVGCFLYVNRTVSRLFHKICGLSLAMEQIAAGKKPEMDRWKEGILSALANQAELLGRRNAGMVRMIPEEKEGLNRFMENMVHQMKTPLTAIRLDLDLMETRSEMLPEAVKNKLEDCQEQCGRLKETVDELLNSSRLVAGKLVMVSAETSVQVLLDSVKEEQEAFLEQKQIRLETRLEAGLSLFADGRWLKTALSNLLKNSAEAMDGGTILVTGRTEGTEVVLDWQDEGGGMSADEAAHLFDRFYTGKEVSGGTGLGMNMVKEIVEANHGSIQVFPIKEADGRKAGTEFVLRFRILEGAEAYSE